MSKFTSCLEVLVVVDERRSLETVGDCASCFHTICHARWTTGEDTNLWEQLVFFLETVKELVEVGTAKVSYSPQPGEETATRQLLEVPLTDILKGCGEYECIYTCMY